MAKDFDSFLKEIVQERIDEIPCPPKEEVWQQMKMQLRSKRNGKIEFILNKSKPTYAVCVVIIILVMLFIAFQTSVMAFMNNVMRNWLVVIGNVARI